MTKVSASGVLCCRSKRAIWEYAPSTFGRSCREPNRLLAFGDRRRLVRQPIPRGGAGLFGDVDVSDQPAKGARPSDLSLVAFRSSSMKSFGRSSVATICPPAVVVPTVRSRFWTSIGRNSEFSACREMPADLAFSANASLASRSSPALLQLLESNALIPRMIENRLTSFWSCRFPASRSCRV